MDKIWDRKSFEVGGHWPLWRRWKNEWPRRTDKSRMLKKQKNNNKKHSNLLINLGDINLCDMFKQKKTKTIPFPGIWILLLHSIIHFKTVKQLNTCKCFQLGQHCVTWWVPYRRVPYRRVTKTSLPLLTTHHRSQQQLNLIHIANVNIQSSLNITYNSTVKLNVDILRYHN